MKRRSELHNAAASGDIAGIQSLLSDGADVEEHNSHGWTPLMAAALAGQVDCVRALLDGGAKLHTVNREGKSALHYAAMRGGPEAVRLLIRLGADVNAADTFGGYTPLHLAAGHAQRESVQETASVLLAVGADVDARTRWNTTPLFSAAVRNAGELVDFLIRHGAEVDARDAEGRTILVFVAKMGFFPDMVERLLAHGADVNAQDDAGRTALMYAALNARQTLMNTLLDTGAAINMEDTGGRTALMYAAGEAPKASEIGMLGREAGTTVDGPNAPHWPADKKQARVAKAYHARAEAVRLLRVRGADTDQRDAGGRTALDLARENARIVGADNAEVVKALGGDADT